MPAPSIPEENILCENILKKIKSFHNEKNLAGMKRFGINVEKAYGAPIPALRKVAKETGKNHALAKLLWDSQIHEARIIAGMIEEPSLVTEKQMEDWVSCFDSWDVCDQICSNLFDKTEFAWKKASEWSIRKEEFVKRAGFVLMACLSVHDKKADDEKFVSFLPLIKRESVDERNFVKKAVNWALRQIGKRNKKLNKKAIATAREIRKLQSKSARWIASNVLAELESEAVRKRLR